MSDWFVVDLFSGAGGAARGLVSAGIPADAIIGIDHDPRRGQRYPGRFICADALQPPVDLSRAAFVWASPPCQAYIRCLSAAQRRRHPDLVARTRELLRACEWWAIENVPGAPIRPDLVLTGPMLGLPVIERRRHFEVSWSALTLVPPPEKVPPFSSGRRLCVTRSLSSSAHFYPRKRIGLPGPATKAEALAAMGIAEDKPQTWTRLEIANAVPPPYAAEVIRHAVAAGWNLSRRGDGVGCR